MKIIFIFSGIFVWFIDFFVFIYWLLIIFKTRNKVNQYPYYISKKIIKKSKESVKKCNWTKIAISISILIISLWQIRLLLVNITNKKFLYDFRLLFLVSVTLPGIVFLLLVLLIDNTFYKISKRRKTQCNFQCF